MPNPPQPTEQSREHDENGPIQAIYHTDPLCGWCFAIADELSDARAQLGSDVNWTIRMGGLVTGDRVRPIGNDADYLRNGLAQVAEVSGRHATPVYFDDVLNVGTWISDSEPTCRAVLTAIELGGTHAGFTASHFLSDRLYIDGLEPDTHDSIAALAHTLDLDPAEFVEHWRSERTRADLQQHWTTTRATGLTTYPTIAVETSGRLLEVVTGFAHSATIIDKVLRATTP